MGVWSPDNEDGDDTNDTDDLVTITAQGSDPSGTYRWQVMQESLKIRLIDTDTGLSDFFQPVESQTVRIRGVAQSQELNDVVIKVTHTTTNDPPCTETDMIELTVIMATLTFNSTGYWTGHDPNPANNDPAEGVNDVPPGAFAGHPQLGEVTPGSPPGTIVWGVNMEIRAVIQPCIDNLECVFDFKRQRQGLSLAVDTVTENVQTLAGHCPPPLHCNDDNVNDDEDLIPDPPPACSIFVIDSPKFDINGDPVNCPFSLTGIVGVHTMNFREWLNIDGFRASNMKEWFSRVEVSCVEVGENQSEWQMTEMFTQPPRLGQGNPIFPVIGFAGFVTQQDGGALQIELNSLVDALSGPVSREIFDAGAKLQSLIEEKMLSPEQRGWLTHQLIEVAAIERDEDDPLFGAWYAPEQTAMRLLGHLKASEAIPALIRQLPAYAPADAFLLEHETAAVWALAEIGEPAVGPLLERTAIANEKEWRPIFVALRKIDRKSPLVRQGMETMLDAQRELPPPIDDAEKANRELIEKRLTEFLKTPEPRRPEPGPTANLSIESSFASNR